MRRTCISVINWWWESAWGLVHWSLLSAYGGRLGGFLSTTVEVFQTLFRFWILFEGNLHAWRLFRSNFRSTQILKPVHDEDVLWMNVGLAADLAPVFYSSHWRWQNRETQRGQREISRFHFFARNLKYSIGKKVEKIMAPTCFIESKWNQPSVYRTERLCFLNSLFQA